MALFVDYYMEGIQKDKWHSLIREYISTNQFPPGKGFLYEIDQVIKTSTKASMENRVELYQRITDFCI